MNATRFSGGHVRLPPITDIDPQPYRPPEPLTVPRFCLEFPLIGIETETEIKSNIGRADMTLGLEAASLAASDGGMVGCRNEEASNLWRVKRGIRTRC